MTKVLFTPDARADLRGIYQSPQTLPQAQYIIFYSLQQQHIRILGLLHGKRDVATIMSRRHS